MWSKHKNKRVEHKAADIHRSYLVFCTPNGVRDIYSFGDLSPADDQFISTQCGALKSRTRKYLLRALAISAAQLQSR